MWSGKKTVAGRLAAASFILRLLATGPVWQRSSSQRHRTCSVGQVEVGAGLSGGRRLVWRPTIPGDGGGGVPGGETGRCAL